MPLRPPSPRRAQACEREPKKAFYVMAPKRFSPFGAPLSRRAGAAGDGEDADAACCWVGLWRREGGELHHMLTHDLNRSAPPPPQRLPKTISAGAAWVLAKFAKNVRYWDEVGTLPDIMLTLRGCGMDGVGSFWMGTVPPEDDRDAADYVTITGDTELILYLRTDDPGGDLHAPGGQPSGLKFPPIALSLVSSCACLLPPPASSRRELPPCRARKYLLCARNMLWWWWWGRQGGDFGTSAAARVCTCARMRRGTAKVSAC